MVIPLTIFIIFVLLFMNTKSLVKAGIVMLAVPFSLIGAIWFLYILKFNVSIAVWVGMIALMGLDAETGVFMLLFLDLSYYDQVRQGRMKTFQDLKEAVIHGAVKRIRPKMMTVTAMFMGLLPIMWSLGTGSDMMKRIAAPMIGGVFSSFILELLVYPPIYAIWKWRYEMKHGTADPSQIPVPHLGVIKRSAAMEDEHYHEQSLMGHGDHSAPMNMAHAPKSAVHQAHNVGDFKRRFWVSLIATIPILGLSRRIQSFSALEIHSGWRDTYVLFILSSFVFFMEDARS